jgi:hypothetical protein
MILLNIRLLIFFILSLFVMTSQQQCLGTYRLRNSGFTFALAQVKDGINRNPIAAQEACYYGCGAQIVTQSSNRGDMYHLTLMDSAASALRASGVLKIGESYLLVEFYGRGLYILMMLTSFL